MATVEEMAEAVMATAPLVGVVVLAVLVVLVVLAVDERGATRSHRSHDHTCSRRTWSLARRHRRCHPWDSGMCLCRTRAGAAEQVALEAVEVMEAT